MLGQLPTTLEVCGKSYPVRSDYRNVLQIISAYNDKELSDKEKAFVCIRRLYERPDEIPQTKESYTEALREATRFIECRQSADKPGPRVVNWEKDEQLIFPAINKVAGMEVRLVPYMHWWTFLGYFQSIDREDLWGFVLTLRQKKAKRKKLEKHEKEFWTANRDLCSLEPVAEQPTPEDAMQALYQELLASMEGGDEDG